MAASKVNKFLEDINEHLECSICTDQLKDPKTLNCLHTFCMTCLEKWVTTKGTLTCPTCCKTYPIPEGGLHKLAPNTFLNNILETVEHFLEKDEKTCVCGLGEKVESYCQDCKEYICSICCASHKGIPALRSHKLYSMNDMKEMSQIEITSLHPSQCLLHGEPLEYYCQDCEDPICMNCTIMGHRDCVGRQKPIAISEAFKTLKETSAELEKDVYTYTTELENSLKEVHEVDTELEKNKAKSLQDIEKYVQETIKTIKKNGEAMEKQVKTIYEMKKTEIDEQRSELRQTVTDVKTKLNLLHKLLKGNEVSAMKLGKTVVKGLADRVNDLPKTDKIDDGQTDFCQIKQQFVQLQEFNPDNLKKVTANCLTLTGNKSVIENETIVIKVRKQTECEVDASQLNATWITQHAQEEVKFEEENGEYVLTKKITSIGVCRLDVTVDGKYIRNSPMKITVEKELINSINLGLVGQDVLRYKDDCLLVSCCTNVILKCKTSGEYIGKIELPKGTQVYRMFKMKNGDIAFSDNVRKCITICTMDGEVVRTFGQGVLKFLRDIYVDEVSDVVYVADSDNGTVVLDLGSGQVINRWTQPNTYVRDVTMTNQRQILILDSRHGLLLAGNNGRLIKVLVEISDNVVFGKLTNPSAVVVDKHDNIIVSSRYNVQLFDKDGKFIKVIGEIKGSLEICIISHQPRKIAVTNQYDKTLQIFNY
ncbi:tripartite motif-containing protein 2-like [Antedon mediterranea]|uniref:tripartite motif-containing protein 2-like n=1 Tax=Antedon mediterranea TaxID=105859 RepID=UPI003AF81F6F